MPLIGPFGNLTDPVAGALSGSLQSISGDIWILANATWDGTDFHRIDITRAAYGYQIQGQGFIPGEPDLGYFVSGATLWVAQPESYTLIRGGGTLGGNVYGQVGGWELGWTLSQQRQMTIGGGGIEIDGYGTTPYTRVTANKTGSVLARHIGGMVRNAFTALDGDDDNTQESWFWGYVDEYDPANLDNNADGYITGTNHWAVAYLPAGSISSFSGTFDEYLKISASGVVEVSADPTTSLGVATKHYVDTTGGAGGGSVSVLTASYGTASHTLNASTDGAFLITLTGNPTLSFTGSTAGTELSCTVYLKQDSTGGRTVTWTGVKWQDAVPPSLSAAGLAVDILVFTSPDGSTWYGNLAGINYS